MKTILRPEARRVLDRLYAAAERDDDAVVAEALSRWDGHSPVSDWERSEALCHAALPVSREAGQILYLLARSTCARRIVEFGTSFGVSAIHLASALQEGGAGRLIATELHPDKAAAARRNLEEAGLAEWVELCQGHALETLGDLAGPIDMVLLDGWKTLYLPVLRLLEPKLRPGALVVADNLSKFGAELTAYTDHVREGDGYLSVTVPFDDHLEISMRV